MGTYRNHSLASELLGFDPNENQQRSTQMSIFVDQHFYGLADLQFPRFNQIIRNRLHSDMYTYMFELIYINN